MNNKKVLILTYYWPPAGGAGVQRWLKFAKYLSRKGYQLHIYTAQNPEAPAEDSSLLNDVPDDAVVIKKPIWEPFNIYKNLTHKKGRFNAGFLTEENRDKEKWTEKAAMFIRANVFVPDAKMFWIRPSVRFLKKYIKDNDISVVISSGPPHSLHIIAQKLKKKLNIKWIADFRDPWTNIDFYHQLPIMPIIDRYHHRLEKRILKQADQLIVVGEEMKREFSELCPGEKIQVITNGFDMSLRANEDLEDKFTIVHIGSINADRSHESFFKAVSLLINKNEKTKNRFVLKFVGKLDYEARQYVKTYKLEEYVEFLSYLPYNQISAIQERAHLLYLPLNNTSNAKGILTGKFFEYLAARRYILAQGPVDGDVSKILQETHSGEIVGFTDTVALLKIVEKQFNDYLNNQYHFNSQGIQKYDRENLTNELIDVLKSL